MKYHFGTDSEILNIIKLEKLGCKHKTELKDRIKLVYNDFLNKQ